MHLCFAQKGSWYWLELGSISPMFYEQLLRAQIPKAQKSCLTVFFVLLGSAQVKAGRRTLVKLTLADVGLVWFYLMLSWLALWRLFIPYSLWTTSLNINFINWIDSLWDTFIWNIYLYDKGVLLIAVGIFGICGNCLTLLVLSKSKNSSFHQVSYNLKSSISWRQSY